ncbi:ROK family protein [Rugamonas sp. DEMB1]|uniref:ROK family protein n=1 Tax=Rugamonas sp. DEMB1 TaxID=3039386 RepID=UPI002447C140|nr:ROK family protein [Rugamonas sp. DEMB1]WGG51413.1 ROK family protein [Rugamonas sp. DEMB1]
MQHTPPSAAVDPEAGAADHLRPRGSNQTGLRQFNERVVLQAMRLHGALPKAELARLTALSTQTVALIVARLEQDALVHKHAPLRGKIGQPSVPIALNPDGAFSFGVNIGRRRLDVLLIDFTGVVRQRASLAYRFPEQEVVFPAIAAEVARMRAALPAALRARLQGVGVAAPLQLDRWHALMGTPPGQAGCWERQDIAARIAADTGLPVRFAKDTAAACVAELVAGRGRSVKSFLYLFVDTFIGGGLVLDSQLYAGLHGNAGAVGSLPLAVAVAGGAGDGVGAGTGLADGAGSAAGAIGPDAVGAAAGAAAAQPAQLLSVASLLGLEQRFTQAGLDPTAATDERAMQAPWLAHSAVWAEQGGGAIAMALASANCLLDLDGAIVDGSCSRALLELLLEAVTAALRRYNWEGARCPQVLAGTIGADARALGGALLPLYVNFAPDPEVFLKLDA